MKKAILALLTLLMLLAGSLQNIRYLDKFTAALCAQVNSACTLWQQGDFDAATDTLDQALHDWLDADSYTHIFVRHSEVDTTSDAFYELQAAVLSNDRGGADAACGKLLYHLESLSSMEHLTFRSIL